jgi:hypothetical protein
MTTNLPYRWDIPNAEFAKRVKIGVGGEFASMGGALWVSIKCFRVLPGTIPRCGRVRNIAFAHSDPRIHY